MKIFLAFFQYGGVDGSTNTALMAEVRADAMGDRHIAQFHPALDDALISRSRSKALSDFLKSNCDVYFSLDHDISWTTGDLVETALESYEEQAIVGGIYSVRSRAGGIAGRFLAEKRSVELGTDQMIESEYVGGGFTAIPRCVVEEIVRSPGLVTECLYNDGTLFYDFCRPAVVSSKMRPGKFEYLSEDWAMISRARLANHDRKIYHWSKPILVHTGRVGFTVSDAGQG